MTPLEFLIEEFGNVKRALEESLRYDYGAEPINHYYRECQTRLAEIKNVIPASGSDLQTIQEILRQLSSLANWICLIERSHLGEFSWPFAAALRTIASKLLTEPIMETSVEPIIHIIAEGEDYKIVFEPMVPPPNAERKFVVIAFPRSLKHHVLLHSLFGHELGHTALNTNGVGPVLQKKVLEVLARAGPLRDHGAVNAWLNAADAPQQTKDTLKKYLDKSGKPYVLENPFLKLWREELTCDLVGIILFGPAFFAAHCTYLQPAHPSPHGIDETKPTHPPYAIRHKMLLRAMHRCGWQDTITREANGPYHQAEKQFLQSLLNDPYDRWADVFDNTQMDAAIDGVQAAFAQYHAPIHDPINRGQLVDLLKQLSRRLPPIIAPIDDAGAPQLNKVHISQLLYAGWVYWEGRQHLGGDQINFLQTNRLCDQALLQQHAIDRTLENSAL